MNTRHGSILITIILALIVLAVASGGCTPAAPDGSAVATVVQQTLQALPGGASAATALPVDPTQPVLHDHGDILTLTISPGHGYRFPEQQFTEEGEYYEMYWNIDLLMFTGVVIPLGEVSDITTITALNLAEGIIDGTFFNPAIGTAYGLAISVGTETRVVILRLLGTSESGDLSIEYIYPFAGQME